jgi:hypothetical protein
MFVARFFAFAVAALASVSFVGAAPTPEKDALVERYAQDSVYSTLGALSVDLDVHINALGSSPLSSPSLSDMS